MMNKPGRKKTIGETLQTATRVAVGASSDELVRTRRLGPEPAAPLVIEPAGVEVDLPVWASRHRLLIERLLLEHGALLFRNFHVRTVEAFGDFIRALPYKPIKYEYGSTPRREVADHIYTSTEYPADQYIHLHNEMSYSSSWPAKIWFYCLEPAGGGGETTLADSRAVFKGIGPEIRGRFMQKRVMYVRNYGPDFDLPWQQVFLTSERSEVESYCRRAGMQWEWKEGGGLRTWQITQAVILHPQTGEPVWFNQVHLFHISGLGRGIGASLLSGLGEENLPRNAYYGDGSAIESDAAEAIREAYAREEYALVWQPHDILMLDNILTAHGRRPFTGGRRVLTAMAEATAAEGI
jgi:alpha-ketoglutarate-dependent taurine dioxygenase